MPVLTQPEAEEVGFAFGEVTERLVPARTARFVRGRGVVREEIKTKRYFVLVRLPESSHFRELQAVLQSLRGRVCLVLKGLPYGENVVDVALDFEIQTQPP